MRNKIYLMLVAAMLAVGCEKEIPLDTEGVEPKVVVNGSVVAGEALTMHLTYSRLIFGWHDAFEDYFFEGIDNATVSLKANGVAVVGALRDSGYYEFGYVPQEGDKLEVKVSVPGHDELSAATVVPHRPVLADMRSSSRSNGEDETEVHIDVRFKLKDNEGEDNYYRLRVFLYDTSVYRYVDNNGDTVTEMYGDEPEQMYFSCNDAAINPFGISDVGIDEEVTYNSLYFTDNAFSGESHEVHLTFTQWTGMYYEETDSTTKKYVEVEVVAMSRDRFLYEQSVQASRESDDLGLFQEPVPVHSNIKNGIGIFAGTAPCRLKAEVAE